MSPQFSTFSQFSSKFSTMSFEKPLGLLRYLRLTWPGLAANFFNSAFCEQKCFGGTGCACCRAGALGGPRRPRLPPNPIESHRIPIESHRISIESPPFVLYTSNLHRNSYRNSIETPSKPPSKPIETHGWPPASDLGPRIVTARLSPPFA